MEFRRTLTCIAGLIGLPIALASPALAAIDSGCSKPIAPAKAAPPALVDMQTTSKAAAILGGRASRLEMIARQQADATPEALAAGAQPPPSVAVPLPEIVQGIPGDGIEPAAGGLACATAAATGLAAAGFAATGLVAVPGRTPLGSNDFLASKRLPVGRTTFDAAWGRVQDGALPQSMLRRALGKGKGPISRDRIAAINSWTNGTIRYVEDRDLYGQSDYWASARTTLKRRAGDCEDIAIAKMQLLAAMGVPRDDMYLTIARDLARNADHAMLVVKFEGEHLLLDNATNALLDASYAYDYRPILSFNTAQTWLHGY